MGIYLGNSGHVELQRDSLNVPLHSLLDPGDVNVVRSRFSFDFPSGALITGDKIEIRCTDGNNLELVDGHAFPDWVGYVGIDDAGGISLYRDFPGALNNDKAEALPLIAPSYAQPIIVHNKQMVHRCLANITSYELTTNRDTVDVTGLGEEFRRQYAGGLISGQGSLNCFWSYKAGMCEDGSGRLEYPHYLAQLCIRTQQGAGFIGRFYLDTSEPKSSLWYEALCIITNVAMSFEPTQPVRSQVQFVTSGPVTLHMGLPPAFLLQESGDLILQEGGDALLLEDP